MLIELSRKDKIKGLKIPENVSPELAYLCGVLAGDGSICYRKSKNEYSVYCSGNPKDEKSFYGGVIGPIFERVFGFVPNLKNLGGGTFGFVIFSKALVLYLTKVIGLPLGKKYDALGIPSVFLNDETLLVNFVRGVFDTDGCISFKKGKKNYPYYPVISLSSKSESFIREIVVVLSDLNFRLSSLYNYKKKDERVKKGFTVINHLYLHGYDNLKLWNRRISFYSPKHLAKIKRYWRK